MPIERLRPTFSLSEERLAELRAVVPEAFADGRVVWDALREALGGAPGEEADEAPEHFGLSWPGKREARRLAARPGHGTLAPRPGEGVNEDETGNIFIEGDNLEVLKLLQKSYSNRIGLIYIDPTYNKGDDKIYKDDYSETIPDYLLRTGQATVEGLPLTTNRQTDGRYHANWLNMMYARLLLARSLLTDSGSIWISIDDNENYNLRAICNEIFGEENFVATFIWEKRTTRENRRVFSFNHDYILCYARDKNVFQSVRNYLPMTEELLARYSNPDNDPRGDWQSVALTAQAGHATPAQFYTITTPGGREVDPPAGSCWRVTRPRLEELIADNRIWFGENGNNVPRRKVFLSEAKEGLTPHTLWQADEVGTTDSAKKELMELFDGKSPFDTPKPVALIQRIVQISTSPDDIVLDFFAGSATTAQAVFEQNKTDDGNRNFILVQLAEPTSDEYKSIAEIGRERIRRVISRLKQQSKEQLALNPDQDLGFRCYRLERSNFKEWQAVEGGDVDQLEIRFRQAETPLVDDWQPADLLVEILLMEGFPLDSRARPLPEFSDNHVLEITSDCCRHRLYVCLDDAVRPQTAAALRLRPEDVFICLDSALTDQAKIALADRAHLKVI